MHGRPVAEGKCLNAGDSDTPNVSRFVQWQHQLLGLTAIDGKPNPGALDYFGHMPHGEQTRI